MTEPDVDGGWFEASALPTAVVAVGVLAPCASSSHIAKGWMRVRKPLVACSTGLIGVVGVLSEVRGRERDGGRNGEVDGATN